MLHAYVQRFDVTGNLKILAKFLASKRCLGQLPESLGKLRSLRKFEIWALPGLTSVPESMCCLTSLEQLRIWDCPSIRSLAEGIKGLTAL
jgi:hypothetical protein